MSLRVLALLGAAVALAVWVAAVRPAAQEIALAQREFARAREERERLRQRTAVLERRVAARAQLVAASSAASGDAVKALRRLVVDSVSKTPLSEVRLEVSPGRAPTAARVRLSVLGPFREILRFGERLLGAQSGLALERVHITATSAGRVIVEIEAFTLGPASP